MLLTLLAITTLCALAIVLPIRYFVLLCIFAGAAVSSIEHFNLYAHRGSIRILGQPPHIFALLALAGAFCFRFATLLAKTGWLSRWPLWFYFYVSVILIAIGTSPLRVELTFFLRELFFLTFPLLVFILARHAAVLDPKIRSITWRYALPSFVAAITLGIIWSVAVGRQIIGTDYLGTTRFMGGMGWASMSYFTLVGVIVGVAKIAEDPKIRLSSLLPTLLVSAAFVASLARTSFLALAIALLLMILTWQTKSSNKRNIAYIVTGVIGTLGSLYFLPAMIARSFNERGDFMFSGRVTAMNYLSSTINNKTATDYLFGNGFGVARGITEELARVGAEARSRYLVFYYDIGAIGLGLYVAFIIAIIWYSIRSYRRVAISQHRENSEIRGLNLARIGLAASLGIIGLFDNLTFAAIIGIYFAFFSTMTSEMQRPSAYKHSRELKLFASQNRRNTSTP